MEKKSGRRVGGQKPGLWKPDQTQKGFLFVRIGSSGSTQGMGGEKNRRELASGEGEGLNR